MGQGNYQSRTKLAYSAPITVTLEMKQSGNSDECGDFQVFGRVNERHSGYNAGMGWWTHYTGYGYNGADGHNQWALKDGSSQRWRQFTISVHKRRGHVLARRAEVCHQAGLRLF